MSRKRMSTSKITSRRATDNFKRIQGIGPITEKRLHDAGVRTYSQLASLSVQAVALLIPNLSKSQIAKQDWIQQAHKLASIKTKPKTKKKKNTGMSHQHYENFTVEFLLDEKNKIHHMRAVHVQSGDVSTWATWNSGRLIDFLAWHTGTHLSYVKTAHSHRNKAKPILNPISKLEEPVETITKESPLESTSIAANDLATGTIHRVPSQTLASTTPSSQIHLLEWNTVLANMNQPLHNIPHDQSFDVRLILDLSDMQLRGISELHSTVTLFAKRLGDNYQRTFFHESQVIAPRTDTLTLTITGLSLSEGLYRLEAGLTLTPIEMSTAKDIVKTSFQGGLLQIY